MPRPASGPRLYFHEQKDVWVVRDGSAMRSTGCRRDDRENADKALADYILQKRRAPEGPRDASEFKIADVLAIYGQERGPEVASPETIGFRIRALLSFWGDRPASSIKGATCRAYARSRPVSDSTARRELAVLRAALSHCEREGYLIHAPKLWLPPSAPPKDRWLTLNEAARFVQAAKPWPHLQRFILLGLYTGSRSGVLLSLQWQPNTEGGHVDLVQGVLYRQPAAAKRTKKRAPPIPLPRQLWVLLRRWRPSSRQWLIEWKGRPVKKLKRSWALAREAAGLGEDVTPHTMRHTAATWMMQKNAQIHEAAGLLGMDVDTLRRVYGHHHPDFMASARTALER